MNKMQPHATQKQRTFTKKSWLASYLLQHGQKIWQRLIHYYQQLQRLPRQTRRLFSKKLAITTAQAALLLALSGGPLLANNVAVTTTAHGVNPGDGQCSLAEAIITANDTTTGDPFGTDCNDANPSGSDTIILSGNTYNLDYAYDNTYGDTALPLINSNVTIEGNGATFERTSMTPFRIMAAGTGADLTLDNVTISGGNATGLSLDGTGGGIFGYEASITITNTSVITGNVASLDGGGVFNLNPTGNANLSIYNSRITGNSVGDDGGGVYNFAVNGIANLTIHSSVITGNSADDDGGGTVNGTYSGTAVTSVTNSTISNNNSGDDGGGLNNYAKYGPATLTVTNSTISNNDAVEDGGGIYSYSYNDQATVTIQQNSIISANESTTHSGGGIYNHSHLGAASTIIESSTVSGNTADTYGGGSRTSSFNDATTTINNSTISGNTANLPGGGLENYSYRGDATVTITNTSTISGNVGIVGGGAANFSYYGTANITIDNSSISGNQSNEPGGGIYNGGFAGTFATIQNNSTVSNNDSQNGVGGGLFNYGQSTADTLIDNSTISNNTAKTGGGGIYNIAGFDVSLTIQSNSEIRGNVVNGSSTQMVNSQLTDNPKTAGNWWTTVENSTLSGNVQFRSNGWKSNRIANNSILSGADDGPGSGHGGGVANYSGLGDATMTIQDDVMIRDNATDIGRGGGSFNFSYNGNASTQIENSTVSGNSSYLTSGGAENWSKNGNSALNINNSTISGNDTGLVGGGIASYSNSGTSSISIANTTIADNLTEEYGGGIFNGVDESTASLTIENSTISGNSAMLNGGGVYHGSQGIGTSSATIRNSTLSGNTAVSGGGIYNPSNATTNLTHVTVYNNEATGAGGGIANAGGTVNATNSIIAGSTGGDCSENLTTSDYNLDSDGSCVIASSDITVANPNLGPLQLNAPGKTATHALPLGNAAIDTIPDGISGCGTTLTTDQHGIARPTDGNDDGIEACDMGAYEASKVLKSFLPLILNNYASEADLIITDFSVNLADNNVSITIKNVGDRSITEDFWVDLYLNPKTVPTAANDVWELLGKHGAAWGIEQTLAPDASLTLTLNDTFYIPEKSNMPQTIPSDAILYAQVDSANRNVNYGGVMESDETNNVFGPLNTGP